MLPPRRHSTRSVLCRPWAYAPPGINTCVACAMPLGRLAPEAVTRHASVGLPALARNARQQTPEVFGAES